MTEFIPAAPPVENAKPETFSREYVAELRAENKTYRLKANELEAKLLSENEKITAVSAEYESKLSQNAQEADTRIIMAELRAEGLKAGLIDMDGLKLADISKVKLSETGEVVGADEVFKALKEGKPYLFKAATTTSTETPPKASTEGKKAVEMTDEEYRAARSKII